MLHIILYFIVNAISIYAVICLWRCANNLRSRIIAWISIGTMMIFGLHRILLGLVNFGIEKAFNIIDISYQIPEALCITICIELIILPIIIYAYKNCQLLLGKRKTCQNLVISE